MTNNATPTLFKKTSTGAIQQWNITVDGSTIVKRYGQVGGAVQVTFDKVSEGKNLGKSNATTAAEQAEAEAFSQWEQKRKKHYVLTYEDALSGAVDASVIAGGVVPMLAQSYSKHASKIVFPAAVQPKLDGHRCIAMIEDGEVTLWSRTQKPINSAPHVVAAIQALNLPDGTVLDGELYAHDYRDKFEELTSLIRQSSPKSGHLAIQYHIYDTVRPESFGARSVWLSEHIVPSDALHVVETAVVNDEEAMIEAFVAFLRAGYEGLMVRNLKSPYVSKRSYDLQKVKEFDDSEFVIVDVETGRGRMSDKGVFICATTSGDEFKAKLVGSLDALVDIADNPDNYIGQMLTVQYQGLSAYGIPRFPIGLRIRRDV